MFFYGKPVIVSGSGSHMPRPGDYTIDGGYFYEGVGTLNETNFKFDTNAQTAVGNCDFVQMLILSETTATGIPNDGVLTAARFDLQGDSGSGAYIAANIGTTTAKNVFQTLALGTEMMSVNHYHYGDEYTNHPGTYFGTADTVRTGRVNIAAGGATQDAQILFIFCSWNSSSGV